jgi:type VI secretion system ImpM family protein
MAVLFGKLPAHGDFVSRGLSMAEREEIDQWLSGSLAQAQAALGDRFADLFDRAAPWRCAGPGLSGAIAASQDASGRRFPLMVMVDDPEASAVCEELLYVAIGERWDADRLALEAGGDPSGLAERWWVPDVAELNGAFPARLLTAMLGGQVSP